MINDKVEGAIYFYYIGKRKKKYLVLKNTPNKIIIYDFTEDLFAYLDRKSASINWNIDYIEYEADEKLEGLL